MSAALLAAATATAASALAPNALLIRRAITARQQSGDEPQLHKKPFIIGVTGQRGADAHREALNTGGALVRA